MKLIDVCEFYAEQGGGVRSYVHAKFAAGEALGHEVIVVAPGAEDREERQLGGRIVWVRSPRLPVDPRYRVLLRERAVHAILDREAPDVVEGSSPYSAGLFCARWRGAALKSLVFHQDAVAVYGHTLLGRTLGERRVDRLCAGYFGYLRGLSRRYQLTVTGGAWLAERLRCHGIHAPIAVPFGVDKTLFSPELRSANLRAELLARAGLPATAHLLVAVSRHHPEKRLLTLIDAIAGCKPRRSVGLVLYGDGPLRRLVERKAARVAGVLVAGRLDDRHALARVLASADALLHGSAAETFGLALGEALCSGLPVIAPDRGGAADLAGATYAECYPAGDVRACSAAIERLRGRNQAALRAEAARAGRERVRSSAEHFSALFALYADRIASLQIAPPAR